MPIVSKARLLLALALCVAYPLTASGQANDVDRGADQVRLAEFDEILADVRAYPARLTVVNMWATWCGPCIEEFPDFVRLAASHKDKGLRVVFVSVDFEDQIEAVRVFLQEQNWSEPSYIKSGKDDAFVRAFHDDWSGAVPATFIYGPSGAINWFYEGKTDFEALRKAADKILARG